MVAADAQGESGGTGGEPERRSTDAEAVERAVARETVRAALFGAARSQRLGRYRLLQRLGSGGMGVVFLAHDPRLDRRVALKVLRERLHDEHAQDRLLHEARSTARLSHPNVVAVYDAEIDDGRLFVAMEYVEGESLARWTQTARPWAQAVTMAIQAGRGLAAAHAAGLVHRDFKPANVLVGRDGRARVADFGLATGAAASPVAAAETASAVPTTGLAGTLAYMAPEQLVAGISDARSDQYAFAVSLHELLFGRRPFEAGSVPELARAILERPLELPREGPTLPAALREALMRGLARAPADRHADMDRFVDALEATVGAQVARTTEVTPTAPSSYPRCQDYLSALGGDLDGHRYFMRASLVRLAVTARPLGADAPAAVQETLAHASLAGAQIGLARARLVLLAIFDQHFGTLAGWREFYRGLIRGELVGGIRAFGMPPASSAWVQRFVARSWNACYPSAPMQVETIAAGKARVSVPWPAVLRDPLVSVELAEHLRATLELAGARFFEFRELPATDGVEGEMVWQ